MTRRGGWRTCKGRGREVLGVGQSDTQTMEVEAESVFYWKQEMHSWRSSLSVSRELEVGK